MDRMHGASSAVHLLSIWNLSIWYDTCDWLLALVCTVCTCTWGLQPAYMNTYCVAIKLIKVPLKIFCVWLRWRRWVHAYNMHRRQRERWRRRRITYTVIQGVFITIRSPFGSMHRKVHLWKRRMVLQTCMGVCNCMDALYLYERENCEKSKFVARNETTAPDYNGWLDVSRTLIHIHTHSQ